MNVDWTELTRERERQITHNNLKRKAVVGKFEYAQKTEHLITKMKGITQAKQEKAAKLEQSRVQAKRNQEDLATMIKAINEKIGHDMDVRINAIDV